MSDVTRRNAVKLAAAGAALAVGATSVQAQDAKDKSEGDKRPEPGKMFKDMLERRDIVGPLAMANGETSGSITASTSFPGQSQVKNADWAFIVPDGYIRYSANFQKQHNGGDVAECDWANGNPADGTVHAHVKASQTNGYARAACDNVYAINVAAAKDLYKKSLEAANKPK